MNKPKIRWIGNKRTTEFHRVEAGKKQPKGCQLDEIQPEHLIEFKTAREAMTTQFRPATAFDRKAYDPCAYCRKKFNSRR